MQHVGWGDVGVGEGGVTSLTAEADLDLYLSASVPDTQTIY